MVTHTQETGLPRGEAPDRGAKSLAAGQSPWLSDTAILIYISALTVIVHFFTNSRYGFHRDELATLDDARHLAWGYVAYPPVTPFFGRVSLTIFGTSLAGFRFFAAVAQAVALLCTGLMAKELGGGRGAQLLAVAAGLPFCLGGGAVMQYVSFDYMAWVLTAYLVIRLLKSEDPRWWLAVGISVGFGMMSKYSMGFLIAGILLGLFLTDARRYFASKWLWYGVALALLIFLPNLVWLARHHFITLDFLTHIHARDIRWGRTKNFLPDQLKITMCGFPIAVAGLYFYLRSSAGRRYRLLGWMFLVPFIVFVIAKGRGYYMGAGYPMLYAAGSVHLETWLASSKKTWRTSLRAAIWTALLVDLAMASVVTLRVFPVGTAAWKWANKINDDLQEEVGWTELVTTVAQIRDSLPPEDRSNLAILAGNYGEAGAMTLYGEQYNLPRTISGINSFWARGYGDPPPETLIAVGIPRHFLDENFTSCQLVAHVWNRYGIENEETRDHPDLYVCRGLKKSWPVFWRDFQYYG
ncbi:MAG TPA: glycosyltransferase family 39 protein [Candidatus Acidoferrum sp.]